MLVSQVLFCWEHSWAIPCGPTTRPGMKKNPRNVRRWRDRRVNRIGRQIGCGETAIGPARKRALLRHFGTAKAVSRASVDDLLAVQGISAQTAQTIYDHFHENGG